MPFMAMVTLGVCLAAEVGQSDRDLTMLARNQRAVSLAERGNFEEAIEILRKSYAQSLETGNDLVAAQAAGFLGAIYRFRGEISRAIPLLRFAKSRFAPGGADAALVAAQLGLALAQDGKLATAEQELRSAGTHPAVRIHLAAVLIQRGALAEAQTLIEEVLRQPDSTEPAARAVRAFAHLSLARLFSAKAQSENAGRHYRSALKIYDALPMKDHPDRIQAAVEYEQLTKPN